MFLSPTVSSELPRLTPSSRRSGADVKADVNPPPRIRFDGFAIQRTKALLGHLSLLGAHPFRICLPWIVVWTCGSALCGEILSKI
jgi:hypothetical protein